MILYKFNILFVLFFFGWNTSDTCNSCETPYEIQAVHPGIDLAKPIEKILMRSSCDLGEPTVFYMDVESVVCGDSQCRIDIVRIYWDELGFYKKLELPNDVALEKAKGAEFTQTDYQKLDSILSDRHSNLKEVDKYEVTGSETSEGIDALSGATIALDTKSYVKGAVWTCYTLWHWANGNTTESIRDITGDSLTEDELLNHLKAKSHEYRIFGMQQLIRKKCRDSKVVDQVLKSAPTADQELRKLIIEFIERLPQKQYLESIAILLDTENEALSIFALRSLLKSEIHPSTEYLNSLGNGLSNWESYRQIDLFLNVLEKQVGVSQEMVTNVMPLLECEDFLIARRAYWFLSQQELSKQDEIKLQTFYKKKSKKL